MVALRQNERTASANDYYRQQAWNNSNREPLGFVPNWEQLQRERLIDAEAKIQWAELTDAKREYLISVARAYVSPEAQTLGETLENDQAGNYRALSEPISALQENLLKAAKLCAKFIMSRPSMPILANVRIIGNRGGFKLTTTNLEAAVMVKVGGTDFGHGGLIDTTIPAKLFADLLEQLPAERVDVNQNRIDYVPNAANSTNSDFHIKCGPAIANIKTISASEFPALPIESGVKLGTVEDTAELKRALLATIDGCAKTDNRPALCFVKATFSSLDGGFAGIHLSSADGARLTNRMIEMTEDRIYDQFTAMLPASSLKLIAVSLDNSQATEIYDTKSCVWFCQPGIDMLIRKGENINPIDTSRVEAIAYTDSATVNYGEFQRAVKAAKGDAVIITGKAAGKLTITAESLETGDSKAVLNGSIKRDFGVTLSRTSLLKTTSALGGSAAKPGKSKIDKKTFKEISYSNHTVDLLSVHMRETSNYDVDSCLPPESRTHCNTI